MGIVSGGTSWGIILNGLLVPIILHHDRWQTVWLVFGLASFVIGLLGIRYVTKMKYEITEEEDAPAPAMSRSGLSPQKLRKRAAPTPCACCSSSKTARQGWRGQAAEKDTSASTPFGISMIYRMP